jgi:hypothetical protein
LRLFRFLFLVIAGLWLVGEIALIPLANARIENEVAKRTRDATNVNASIGSFPVATRVLITGKVPKLSVTLERIARQALTFAEVKFDLSGIGVDRPSILQGKAKINSIDSGTVTATIDAGVLGRIASLAGADVRVDGRTLRVAGRALALDQELIPCEPTARIEGEKVLVTCTLDEVPDILLEAVQQP